MVFFSGTATYRLTVKPPADVYNTAINQLAEGGRLPDMKPVVERYGLQTRLQDLDDLQPLRSGIPSPPRLVLQK